MPKTAAEAAAAGALWVVALPRVMTEAGELVRGYLWYCKQDGVFVAGAQLAGACAFRSEADARGFIARMNRPWVAAPLRVPLPPGAAVSPAAHGPGVRCAPPLRLECL
jgi:hypothetical protein